MRILILVHNLTGGGAERVAALWATGFVNEGNDVGVVLNCPQNTSVTYDVPQATKLYNIYNWLANKLKRRLGIDCYYVRRLRKVIAEFKPDVIIGVLPPWAELARKAARGMNVSIINTEHNSFERPDSAPMPQKTYKEKYIYNRRYDYITVLTQADKDCMKDFKEKTAVLPNPLAFAAADSVPPKEKIILAAGRLGAWHYKGFDLLIKAWGEIAKNYPDWKLQIAGNDTNHAQQYLQSLADKEQVGNQLEFLGYQSKPLPFYQRASIFVLSSRYEGFGMVLIEAMSQGCAPIACDYKGRQREIITSDKEGLICPTDDVNALKKSLVKMIEDESYRENVQKEAIIRSRYYRLENIMTKWNAILYNVKNRNL